MPNHFDRAHDALDGRPSMTRRHLLQGAGATAVGALTLSFGTPGAHASTTLTLMTVGGSWGDSIRDLIAQPFAEKHGLSLAFDNRPNAQQLAALQAMRNNVQVDSVEIGGPRLGQAISMELLAPIDESLAPNFKRVYPSLKNAYWAPRSLSPFVLSFNTDEISKEEAEEKGWELLIDPRLRGRVAIPTFGWMGEMWLHAVNQAMGGEFDNIDRAITLAQKIIQENEGLVMGSNDQGMTLFTTGEIVAAPFWTGRSYELRDNGIPLDFVYPQGWSSYGFGFSVLAGGPNMELAQRFVDYSLNPEVQLAVAERFSYVPTLAGLELPPELERSRVPEGAFDRAANLDYSKIIQHSDTNLERWNREVLA